MTRVLVTAIYLLFSATLGVAVFLFADVMTGFLVGAVTALGCVQIHSAMQRRRERKIIEREISGLKRVSLRFEQALDETRSKIEELSRELEAKTSAQSRKIIAELQVLESVMHDFATRDSDNAKKVRVVEPVIERRQAGSVKTHFEPLGESDLLATIRASLEQNRVDLYLQPIVSLPQRKLRFYEALSRLRAEDGSVIMPAQYIKIAEPAGLMSVVDNLLLFRCVQIVRRLTQKQRDIGVFCNISGDTLVDGGFFPQFLDYMHHNRDLAGQIVFEFAQQDVLRCGAQAESNLAYLASLGFALSMDHVDSLALDFIKLKKLGFRYIKVRAHTLMDGMANAKKLLERHGLDLIAERVEDEGTVVQLLEFGIDFAQGYLFGAPRALRDDSLKAMETEPATAPIIPFRKAS
jgi:cyclic-di-GMP phosphodiesterase TipF (flagellum assembly factor)